MSATKAFMSPIDGGPVWLDSDHVEGDHFAGQPAEEYAAKWAENEARGILSETERQEDDDTGAHHYRLGQRQFVWPGTWERLAESLAAFCEREGF